MDPIVLNMLNKRKAFYADKLKTFSSWSTKKCSMNGTSDKYIRNMLSQILKELSIPVSSSTNIINNLYTRDFSTDRLVCSIDKYNKNQVFDLLNSDQTIKSQSIDIAIKSLNDLKVPIYSLNPIQTAGLCIFVQFILCGGRNDLEGFGVAENLVEKWKRMQKIKKMKEIEQRNKEMEEARKNIKYTVDDEEENTTKDIKEDQLDVPDSWEDL